MSAERRKEAIQSADWVVATHAPAKLSKIEMRRRRLRGKGWEPDPVDWLEKEAGFAHHFEGNQFTVYRRGTNVVCPEWILEMDWGLP